MTSSRSTKLSLPFPVKGRLEHLTERIHSMYGPGDLETDTSKIAYKLVYGRTDETPKHTFAFELIAIPFAESEIREKAVEGVCEFYGLVNDSYSSLGTRFEGLYYWFNKKGYSRFAHDIVGCLQHHGFLFDSSYSRTSKSKVPCIIVGNLLSDRVDYTEKSKAKMDTSPFTKTILKAVSSITPKIKTFGYYDIRFETERPVSYSRSRSERVTRTSIKAIVEMMLMPRIRQVLYDVGNPITTRQTQDSLWYNALPLFEKYNVRYSNISRAHFKQEIRKLCKEHDIAREQIGILAAPWGTMFFNGEWYDISYDTIKELAEKGTDIVFIEKRDIVMALGIYASAKGVALVNTHGILSDYTEELAELAHISGGHVAILTDYDIPGILIASKLGQSVPRLGIDERTLRHFGISRDDTTVVIPYTAKRKRLKEENLQELVENDSRFNSKDVVDIDFLRRRKIEIDAILAKVGPERFWQYLQDLLGKEFEKRDYGRVIDSEPDLSSHYPPIIKRLQSFFDNHVSKITEDKSNEYSEELEEVEGFIDVKEKEREIDEELGKIVESDPILKEIADAIEQIDRDKSLGIAEEEGEEGGS